ncbi:hypothetical protein B0O80DRAFT_498452 [Mortierella sp. GBAus27b]|nr:hypothetical protein B0O80DRAFT_498452 [Mortierella sp. GBAus27b]
MTTTNPMCNSARAASDFLATTRPRHDHNDHCKNTTIAMITTTLRQLKSSQDETYDATQGKPGTMGQRPQQHSLQYHRQWRPRLAQRGWFFINNRRNPLSDTLRLSSADKCLSRECSICRFLPFGIPSDAVISAFNWISELKHQDFGCLMGVPSTRDILPRIYYRFSSPRSIPVTLATAVLIHSSGKQTDSLPREIQLLTKGTSTRRWILHLAVRIMPVTIRDKEATRNYLRIERPLQLPSLVITKVVPSVFRFEDTQLVDTNVIMSLKA